MSGMTYEIQRRQVGNFSLATYKHPFNYQHCKMKCNEYGRMTLKEFKECLKDPQKLGEIGHLSSFIYWVQNKDRSDYRDALGDYGLIHLLFHCLGGKEEIKKHAEYIHELFKTDIRLA
ncbi:hypothetical protein [Aquimarina aggregata]|uniref:hypothetical protein n=1 Tax=Aquimarina aggregata TaxID=1642818 RepID=UPI0024933E78|nr:hypothetical protein [Aquimarina aggregata]